MGHPPPADPLRGARRRNFQARPRLVARQRRSPAGADGAVGLQQAAAVRILFTLSVYVYVSVLLLLLLLLLFLRPFLCLRLTLNLSLPLLLLAACCLLLAASLVLPLTDPFCPQGRP